MAFRSKVSPVVRSFFAVSRSPIVSRTLTSQSKESAWYFRFVGPFVIGATAAGAGLLATSRLYNNNFIFGNLIAASNQGNLLGCCFYLYLHRYGILLRPQRNICLRGTFVGLKISIFMVVLVLLFWTLN